MHITDAIPCRRSGRRQETHRFGAGAGGKI